MQVVTNQTTLTMVHNNQVVSVFMPALRWQISLVLVILFIKRSAQSMYYITPTTNTLVPCPGEHCHTLSEYAADQYFNNFPANTTLEFLPGNHTLEQTISVKKLAQLVFHGDSSSLPEITSRIVCTWPAGFVFTDITELHISALAFISCGHGDGAAVKIISVTQSSISNCIFHSNMNANVGGALYIQESDVILALNKFQHNYALSGGALGVFYSSSIITDNTFGYNSALFGGALCVVSSTLILTRSTFQNNSAYVGGALAIQQFSDLILTWNTFQNNSADWSGGALDALKSTTDLIKNTFHNNSAELGGALSVSGSTLDLTWNAFQNNSATFGGAIHVEISTLNLTEGNIIGNNIAQYGGGVVALYSQMELAGNISFESNTATYGGGMHVHNTQVSGQMIFTYNSATEGGGGVYASKSTLNFIGESTLNNNLAGDGGGLLIVGESKFYLQQYAHVHFISNSAKRTGGAIKVEESNPLIYCIDYKGITCFFQIAAPPEHKQWYAGCEQYITDLNVSITFYNNSAAEAGADLYGGSVDHCVYFDTPLFTLVDCLKSGDVFDAIASRENENTLDISSDPLYICTCKHNLTDCSGSYHHPEPVYPGGTLEIPVIAHGQRNGATPAVIQAISTHNNSSITFQKHESIQNVDNQCTVLTYTIHSYEESTKQKITLYTEGPCLPTDTSLNMLRVLIDISHCPPGFQISEVHPKCVCAERLQKFTNMCLVDDKEVLRAQYATFWVGYDSTSQGLILHPHCPFNYCTVKEIYLEVEDSDKQCNYNRSGILCGKCSENLSLALGSSRCLQCSNAYLTLLVAFIFSGIALVLLLLVLRLTVAAGKINGLIIYANVVAVNSAIFFHPRTTNILTVFIAWLNLDLGIESCFYNGMDAYVKTWLQFAFPLYVWTLVGLIIIGSHYSGRIAIQLQSLPHSFCFLMPNCSVQLLLDFHTHT